MDAAVAGRVPKRKGSRVVDAVLALSREADEEIRSAAAYALGKIEPCVPAEDGARVTARLLELTADPSLTTRQMACWGLARLGHKVPAASLEAATKAFVRLARERDMRSHIRFAQSCTAFAPFFPPESADLVFDELLRLLKRINERGQSFIWSGVEAMVPHVTPGRGAEATRILAERSK